MSLRTGKETALSTWRFEGLDFHYSEWKSLVSSSIDLQEKILDLVVEAILLCVLSSWTK